MPLDLVAIRSQFPALSHNAIYLDNPAGTQVVRTVLDRINNYLVEHNANHEGCAGYFVHPPALLWPNKLKVPPN